MNKKHFPIYIIIERTRHKDQSDKIYAKAYFGTHVFVRIGLKEQGDTLTALDKIKRESKMSLTEFLCASVRYKGIKNTLTERIAATLNQAFSFLRKNMVSVPDSRNIREK